MSASPGTRVYLVACVLLVVSSGKKWMLINHNEGLRRGLYHREEFQAFHMLRRMTVAVLYEITCVKLATVSASVWLLLCSCRKSGICTLWPQERKLVDCRRRGDSPPCGRRHHFHPVLETVPHRQAGVPARHHDLYSAETEGRAAAQCFIPPIDLRLNRQEVVNFIFRTFDSFFSVMDGTAEQYHIFENKKIWIQKTFMNTVDIILNLYVISS